MEKLCQRYNLRQQLYEGRTSCVIEGVDRRTGEQVALKVFKKRSLSDAERTRLKSEIQIHGSLEHPNIIRLVATFEDERAVYLVQEFAGGGDVFGALQAAGRFDEEKAARAVVAPLLSALKHLHDKGIIHRDVKHENCLLDSRGKLKLADFGLATTEQYRLARTGTWEYMAPEIHPCRLETDPTLLSWHHPAAETTCTKAVDIWAAGVLTYELLVGKVPFAQLGLQAAYEDLMEEELVLPGWLSREARSFISAALCKAVADVSEHPASTPPPAPSEAAQITPSPPPPRQQHQRQLPLPDPRSKQAPGMQRVLDWISTIRPAASSLASARAPQRTAEPGPGSSSLSGGDEPPAGPGAASPRRKFMVHWSPGSSVSAGRQGESIGGGGGGGGGERSDDCSEGSETDLPPMLGHGSGPGREPGLRSPRHRSETSLLDFGPEHLEAAAALSAVWSDATAWRRGSGAGAGPEPLARSSSVTELPPLQPSPRHTCRVPGGPGGPPLAAEHPRRISEQPTAPELARLAGRGSLGLGALSPARAMDSHSLSSDSSPFKGLLRMKSSPDIGTAGSGQLQGGGGGRANRSLGGSEALGGGAEAGEGGLPRIRPAAWSGAATAAAAAPALSRLSVSSASRWEPPPSRRDSQLSCGDSRPPPAAPF